MKPLYLIIIGVVVIGAVAILLYRGTDDSTDDSNSEDQGLKSVTGTVTYLQRIALSPDAVVKVKLQDVSLQDVAAELISEQVIKTDGNQVPFAYELEYDPDDIVDNHTYSVSARIEDSDGKLLFISDTSIPVITNDNPTKDVEILVVQTP